MTPHVLLAEGAAELRDLYGTFLREQGYDVAVAANGLDCLQQLEEDSPDALVLDLDLLWGGGEGILGWLREDRSRAEVPVILTTTGRHPRVASDVTPPVVALLRKPIAPAALAECLCNAITEQWAAQSHQWASRHFELEIG